MTIFLQNRLCRAVKEDLLYERQYDDLFLYIYTPRTVRERLWSNTTRTARGIILDNEGNIVCRPFDKFHNIYELPSTEPKNFPNLPFTIEEKIDGTLINIWERNGKWNCSTKGSIESGHANYAREHLLHQYDYSKMNPNWTLMCEGILPQELRANLPVNYGDYLGLKLLAVRNKHTGSEEPAGRIPIIAEQLGMDVRKTYHFNKIEDLPMSKNMEGYVVRFENNLRIKIKNPWYLRLHRALDAKTTKRVLELVEAGEWRAFWDSLPKDIQKDFDDLYAIIRTAIWDVKNRANAAWKEISDNGMVKVGRCGRSGRRDFAVWVTANIDEELRPIMFSILDGREWHHLVYNIVRKNLK